VKKPDDLLLVNELHVLDGSVRSRCSRFS